MSKNLLKCTYNIIVLYYNVFGMPIDSVIIITFHHVLNNRIKQMTILYNIIDELHQIITYF